MYSSKSTSLLQSRRSPLRAAHVDPTFETSLLAILQKFSKRSTVENGQREISEFLRQEVSTDERMLCLLYKLARFDEHMDVRQKQELIKVYG